MFSFSSWSLWNPFSPFWLLMIFHVFCPFFSSPFTFYFLIFSFHFYAYFPLFSLCVGQIFQRSGRWKNNNIISTPQRHTWDWFTHLMMADLISFSRWLFLKAFVLSWRKRESKSSEKPVTETTVIEYNLWEETRGGACHKARNHTELLFSILRNQVKCLKFKLAKKRL